MHAYVLGEHGDTEVMHWSGALAGDIPVADFAAQVRMALTAAVRAEIDDGVRRAAYGIIAGKQATYYGIGGGLAHIVQAIEGDEREVITVSIINAEVEGVPQIALSLPRIVGRGGVLTTLHPPLDDEERLALRHSAQTLKAAADSLTIPR